MKAIILAGGDVHITKRLKEQLKDATLVIAADSGIRHAEGLRLKPDLLVGDFDSISPEDKQLNSHVPIVQHQPEKDDLDLELAIQEAAQRGVEDLNFVGVTGSRLDQSLAGVMIAAACKDQFKTVKIFTGKQDIEILQAGESVVLTEDKSSLIFSLLSLVPESVLSIRNAKYPLDHATLKFGTGLGISNERLPKAQPKDQTEVSVHSGLCVLILELDV